MDKKITTAEEYVVAELLEAKDTIQKLKTSINTVNKLHDELLEENQELKRRLSEQIGKKKKKKEK